MRVTVPMWTERAFHVFCGRPESRPQVSVQRTDANLGHRRSVCAWLWTR